MLTGGVSEKGDDAEEKELSCSNSTDENAEKELTTYCAPKTNWQSFFFLLSLCTCTRSEPFAKKENNGKYKQLSILQFDR